MFEVYDAQVKLLLSCLPTVAEFENFALKGGTAINMFIREQYPRLSVDIDLTFLPVLGREETLSSIERDLKNLGKKLQSKFNYKILESRNQQTKTISKTVVDNGQSKITIEPNLILRGTVYPVVRQNLASKVADLYKVEVLDIPVLDRAELYAGKICAALDRQHPRDLFDIKFILEEGISERTKIAFLIYLIGGNRPMFELLAPNRLDQSKIYEDEFVGMSDININYAEMVDIREQLISTIRNILTEDDKQFLLSVKKGFPNWQHINIEHVANLPSVRWKLVNLAKMDKRKAAEYLAKLEAALYD